MHVRTYDALLNNMYVLYVCTVTFQYAYGSSVYVPVFVYVHSNQLGLYFDNSIFY